MLRIESREMLSGVITVVTCYHGWADHKGHTVYHDVCDVDGESTEQLAVAAYDALNRWLKDRSVDHCVNPEMAVLPQP